MFDKWLENICTTTKAAQSSMFLIFNYENTVKSASQRTLSDFNTWTTTAQQQQHTWYIKNKMLLHVSGIFLYKISSVIKY